MTSGPNLKCHISGELSTLSVNCSAAKCYTYIRCSLSNHVSVVRLYGLVLFAYLEGKVPILENFKV